MATSGSTDFSVTRDGIITEALEQLGVIDIGGTPSTSQLTSCSTTLNLWLKNLQADGVNLFAIQKQYLFLQKDINEYLLGSTANISTTIEQATVTTAASSGASILFIDTAAIPANTDIVLIQLSDGTIMRNTSGVGAANTIVLGSTLDDDVDVGATVYWYPTADAANRPMKITQAVRRTKDGTDIPVEVLTLDEYAFLSDKTTDGVPINIYYRPEVGFTRVRVWPEPSPATDYLVLWVQRTLEDFDSATNDPDYPQEWHWFLAIGLAIAVHKKFGVKTSTISHLREEYAMAYDRLQGHDRDEGVYFMPDGDY